MARRDSGKKAAKGGKTRSSRKASSSAVKSNPKGSHAISGWPLKRDVLFKPERYKYVRKQIEIKGCVFCEALAKGPSRKSLLLYADELVLVIMNKYPYNPGHLLILPRRHEGELTELTKAEVDAVFQMVQTCVKILGIDNKPAGFNVGLNLGASAGAGIPEHLHTHVIPRWTGDTNFFPLIAQTKVVVETLEQTYDRLLPLFNA